MPSEISCKFYINFSGNPCVGLCLCEEVADNKVLFARFVIRKKIVTVEFSNIL